MLQRLTLLVRASSVAAALTLGVAHAQTFAEAEITSGGTPGFVFEFDTPAGATGTQMLVAKFLTNDPDGDALTFRVEPTTIAKYPVTPFSIADANVGLEDQDTADVVAVLRARDMSGTDPAETGYRVVKVTVKYQDYTFAASEKWKLQVEAPSSGTSRFTGYWAEGTDETTVETSVTRGYVEATEELEFGELQIGISSSDVDPQDVAVQNLGPGPLQLTGLALAGGSSPFTTPLFGPLSLLPGEAPAAPYQIGFDPSHVSVIGSPGPVSDTLTITNDSLNDPAFEVSLDATAVKLEVALLFDVSGSMGFRPTESEYVDPPPPHDETRLYQAKLAGAQLQFLLQSLEGDPVRVGLYTFPEQGVTGATPSADTVVSMKELSLADTALDSAFGTSSSSLQAPKNGTTPMAEGLDEAHGVLPTSFASDHWTQGNFVRRALIMLSDGAHKTNSSGSLATPADWVTYLNSISDADEKIRVFTVGYGNPAVSGVDHPTLQSLATAGDGGFYDADSLGTASLNKTFRNALVDWRDFAVITDPDRQLTEGQAPKEHQICVDNSVGRVAVVVDWGKIANSAIDFELVSPTGAVFTGASTNVAFHSGANSKAFVVKGSELTPGLWTLRLSGGQGLSNGESVDYAFSAIAKSKVTLSPSTPSKPWLTLDEHLLEYYVELDRIDPIGPITLEYDRPTVSYNNWISSMEGIELEWLLPAERREELRMKKGSDPFIENKVDLGSEATLLERKAYALANFADRPFVDARSTGQIQLYDNGQNGDKEAGDGIYSALLDASRVDGIAHIHAKLNWAVAANCFQREHFMDKLVAVHLTKDILATQIVIGAVERSLLFPKELVELLDQPVPSGYERSIVFARPERDGVLWGPGRADEVKFALQDARPLGQVVDYLDGRYGYVIEHEEGVSPRVAVTVGGITTDPIVLKKASGEGLSIWIWILILLGVAFLVWILRKLLG